MDPSLPLSLLPLPLPPPSLLPLPTPSLPPSLPPFLPLLRYGGQHQEIDYGQEEEGVALGMSAGSCSKLAFQIQDLVRMIFDVESMKKAMKELR